MQLISAHNIEIFQLLKATVYRCICANVQYLSKSNSPTCFFFKCNRCVVFDSSASQSKLTEEDTESEASELLQKISIHSSGLLGSQARLADGSTDNSYSIPTTSQPNLTAKRKESGTTNLVRENSKHSSALSGVLSQLTSDFVGKSFGGPPDASQSQSQEKCDVTGRDTGMT